MQLGLSSTSTLPRPFFNPVPKPFKRHLSISATACRPKAAVTAAAATTATMYELLSVTETAGPDEIKAAYRRQARQWHPDMCPSMDDKGFFAQQFIRAREAYEVLSDPVQREDYDSALTAGVPPCNWAAAVSKGVVFRKGADRAGFGGWESQLEGLKRRRAGRSGGGESTWGSRMRSAEQSGPSD